MTKECISCFGPSQAAAELEASKAYSKDFMARHNIPTAAYGTFTNYEDAIAYLDSVDHQVVVKASGFINNTINLIQIIYDSIYRYCCWKRCFVT